MDKITVIQKDISEFKLRKYYELKIYNLLEEFQSNYEIMLIKDSNNLLDQLEVKKYENKQYRVISNFYTKETTLIDADTLHNNFTFISDSLIISNKRQLKYQIMRLVN